MKSKITLILFALFYSNYSYTQDLDLELFATNLDRPVNIKHAGDDRLFVVEQDGLIRIVNSDGTIESTPFLNIVNRVRSIGNEQGLLGLAFHPDYSTNGFFFVNYINNSGDTVISRFSRDVTNPSLADPNSELVILDFSQPFSNHNGGELAFGVDGYLYISTGDGGSGGDPQANSQFLGNMLGKLLRLDVNNSTVENPYAIPSDNPFVDNPNANEEIWSYGLRNPWKFSFDRTTNDLWIADVGQNAREEINFTASTDMGGLNYGWRCYEGNNTFNTLNCPAMSTLTFPEYEYSHSGGRCSITGGYVYRGSVFPNFHGIYFFADLCSQEIGYLKFENGSWNATLEAFSGSWVAFGEDINGELYVSNLAGNIFKLIDNSLSIDDNQLNVISLFPNPATHHLQLDFSKTTTEVSDITIYNLQGKIVKSVTRNTNSIQNINVSDLSKGLYLLQINNTNGNSSTQKLVIN